MLSCSGLVLPVQLDTRIRQWRGPYGRPCDAPGRQDDPCIQAELLKLLPGLGARLGLDAEIPGADAPDQITLDDHRFLNRDEGDGHRLTAVVLQVSGFLKAEVRPATVTVLFGMVVG